MKDNWRNKMLGDICIYKNGGSYEKSVVDNGAYHLITLNSIDIKGNLKPFHKKINKAHWFLKKDDFIMVLSDVAHGNFLGLVDFIPEDESYVLNQRMGLLRKIDDEINKNYLRYFINHNQKYFKLNGQGSSQLNLKKEAITEFNIQFPPLPQQQKIAKILSTVDTVIEKTQSAIAKYQAIKQGLMHDVFTRGIDVNTGKLRPTPQDAPGLYKESVLGLIPRDWEVEILNDCINPSTIITYGIVQTGEHVEGGIRVLRTVNLNEDGIDSKNLLRTTKAISDSYKRTYLKENDIVCNVRASVGDFNIISKDLTDCNLTRGVARISLKDTINAKYMLAFFRSSLNEKQMNLLIKGTTFIDINIADLRTINVLLPVHIDEQNLIANSITSIESKIQTEQQALAKYQQLKAGLLQDLLTGKVAVTVNEKEVQKN